MRFIMGGDVRVWLMRMTYKGGIGIFYNSILGAIISYILFIAICILTIVGLYTTIKWFRNNKKKK